MAELILASGSPRRKELLAGLGLDFAVIPSTVTEPTYDGSDPAAYAKELAKAKALAVARQFHSGLVIGADTIVVLDGKVLGKPESAAQAVDMLSRLSGRSHMVYTGLAVIDAATGRLEQDVVGTEVQFRPLTATEIALYVRSGEPLDKAGAYGIQGLGAVFIQCIKGCYFNVVGLPLSALDQLLKRFDFAILQRRDHDQRIKQSEDITFGRETT
ncbi:MAG: septum formation inhibitor Maf [Firmicutes bacterium]|nr:septum formation inhibitor Maf [Bacillota bacterium]